MESVYPVIKAAVVRKEPFGQDVTMNLGSSVENAKHARITVVALNREALVIAAAAKNLDGSVRDPAKHLRCLALDHRNLARMTFSPVQKPGGVVEIESGCRDFGSAVGEHDLDLLKVSDFASELLTCSGVLKRELEEHCCLADGPRCNLRKPDAAKGSERKFQSLSFLPKQMVIREFNIVKVQRRMACATQPHHGLVRTDIETIEILVHEKGRDGSALGLGSGFRRNHKEIREFCVRNKLLGTVENPLAILPTCRCCNSCCVRSRARLSEGNRTSALAANCRKQPSVTLLSPAFKQYLVDVAEGSPDQDICCFAKLFFSQHAFQSRQTATAHLPGHVEGIETERCRQLLNSPRVVIRKEALRFNGILKRLQMIGNEFPDGAKQDLLDIGQREVHSLISLGAASIHGDASPVNVTGLGGTQEQNGFGDIPGLSEPSNTFLLDQLTLDLLA